MSWEDFAKIGLGLIGGSVMAVPINRAWDRWAKRVKSLTYEIEQDRVFASQETDKLLQAKLVVTRDGQNKNIDNLSIIKITFRNNLTEDIGAFTFGVTVPYPHEIIRIDTETPGRHYLATCEQSPSPINGCLETDFTLKPFNRSRQFTVKVFVSSINNPVALEDVKVETGMSLTLVRSGHKMTTESLYSWIDKTLAKMSIYALMATVGIIGAQVVLNGINWVTREKETFQRDVERHLDLTVEREVEQWVDEKLEEAFRKKLESLSAPSKAEPATPVKTEPPSMTEGGAGQTPLKK